MADQTKTMELDNFEGECVITYWCPNDYEWEMVADKIEHWWKLKGTELKQIGQTHGPVYLEISFDNLESAIKMHKIIPEYFSYLCSIPRELNNYYKESTSINWFDEKERFYQNPFPHPCVF